MSLHPFEQSPLRQITGADGIAKEIRIQSLKRSNHRSKPAIALLASGAIPEAIVTHRVGIEQAPAAFQTLAEYRDGIGKLAIEFPA